MPPIFKAIITISVWVLFIKGLLSVVVGTIMVAIASMGGAASLLAGVALCSEGIAALILAAVAARIRQKVE